MTHEEFARIMADGLKAHKERAAQGVAQFDGDPEWDRAIREMAQDAVANAEKQIEAQRRSSAAGRAE